MASARGAWQKVGVSAGRDTGDIDTERVRDGSEPDRERPGRAREGRFASVVARLPGGPAGQRGRVAARRRLAVARTGDEGMAGSTAASAGMHAALVALMLLSVPRLPGGRMIEPPSVEVMYERPGSSGIAGPTDAHPQQGTTAGAPDKETPPPPATPPQQVLEAPEPLLSPEMPDQPEASQQQQEAMLQAPKVPETKPTPPSHPHSSKMMRLRMREAPAPSSSTSPFSSPMDLSFASKESNRASRPRRGSGGSIDLSLGPVVHNGALNVPYASTGIKGVSDDYAEVLQEWIQKHLYYPPDAAHRGEDGVSGVHVVIDPSGHVKSIDTIARSGHEALDDATSGMFRGAKLPPTPPDMIGNHFDIDLTVHYVLLHGDG